MSRLGSMPIISASATLVDAPCPKSACAGDLVKDGTGWRCTTCRVSIANAQEWYNAVYKSLDEGAGDENIFNTTK